MSLQVWLPLTKDLRNQGLADVNSVNVQSGCSIDSNGKLGKCYTNSGTATNVGNSVVFSASKFSACAWVRLNTRRDNWTRAFGMSGNGTYFGLGCEHTNGTLLGFHYFKTIDGTNKSVFDTYPISVSTGVWNHFVMCYDGIKYYIYQNGSLVDSRNASQANIDCNMTTLYLFGGTANLYSQCSLNDVRIYDHCLSPMEVKELSKGLVLHYPLSKGGWGQENLFKKTREVFDNNGSRSSSTTVKNGLIIDSTAPNGKYRSWNVVAENNVNRGVYYTYTNSNIALEDLTANETYTLSFWSRCSKTKNLIISSLVESQTVQKVDGGDIPSSGNIVVDNKWQRHSVTFKWTSTSKITTCFYLRSLDENVTLDIASPKLEKGDKATPWCPNSSDALATAIGLNDNIEYDTSGFGNNGTRTGTFSWTSDTPRYSVSQVFSGSQYIVEPNEINTIDSTIALWIKSPLSGDAFVLDARNSSQVGKQPIYQYTDGSIQTGGSSAYVISNTGLLVANTWVHVALVQSGNSLLIYKNGSLFQTISCTNSPLIKPTLGARLSFNYKYTGQLSDFRIYATALSAEDILSLYQASAYIDSQGNTYASSYVEG